MKQIIQDHVKWAGANTWETLTRTSISEIACSVGCCWLAALSGQMRDRLSTRSRGCACITKTSQYWHQGVLIVLEPCYRQVSLLLKLLCCSGSSELCEISNTRSDFGRQLHDRAALEVTLRKKKMQDNACSNCMIHVILQCNVM